MNLTVAFYFVKDAALRVTKKWRIIQKALQGNDSAIGKLFKARGRQRPMKSYFQQGFKKKCQGMKIGNRKAFKPL